MCCCYLRYEYTSRSGASSTFTLSCSCPPTTDERTSLTLAQFLYIPDLGPACAAENKKWRVGGPLSPDSVRTTVLYTAVHSTALLYSI